MMQKIRFFAVVAWICAAALCLADPPKKAASVEGITEYDFDNGLRALLFPDNSQSKVTVNMTALVGSRQEGYGETGMAHLLEHMVFKGTPRHQHIPRELQEHGAQFNGSTSSDRVNYFETMPASDENLEFAIDLEADRLVNSYIKKEDLDSEMTVVRNEFERGENSPGEVLSKRIAAAAYNWHNYGKPTIGNRSDIERVPIQNLQAFYHKYYQPDNIVLIVAGKFEEAKALALVDKYFGAIPRPTRKLPTTYTEEPPQDGERSVVLRRVGDVGVVSLAYHIPAGPHPDIEPLQVLANILTTQPSGRLYKLLQTKTASLSAFAESAHDPGLFSIDAEVPRDGSLEAVRDTIIDTVEHLSANPVTDEEVNRAKQQILKARERASADTSQLAVALSGWAAQGDWRLYFLNRDRIEKVTPAEVQAVAAHYLQRDNRTVGMCIPTEKVERVEVPETPDVAAEVANYHGHAAMAQGEVFEATPDNIEARAKRLELPEGIKVTLLPKKTRGEEAHLTLTLRYGNEENLKGFDAAAPFLPELMLRGTKELSYQDFRDKLDDLGATIFAGGGGGGRRGGGRRGGGGGAGGAAGSITFAVQAKRENMPEAIALLRQVLREPALPADQFDILKNERVARVEQSRTEPSVLGPRWLERALNPWPKDDIRYIPTVDESLDRLRAVTYDQVTSLYHDYLSSQNGELTIVGDFDPDACLAALKPALDGWTAAKPYARIAMPVVGEQTGAKQVIDTPDKANATYVAGLVFPMRDDDAEYPALLMGNFILGSGTLSSRLGDRIRQKEGLTYGVSSALSVSAQDQRASLTITAICNPTNMARLEVCVKEELDRLLKDGVSSDELEKAKQGYLEAQKVGRENDMALAGALTSLRHLDRTMAFDADLEKKIQAVTPEDVVGALRHRIDPTKLVIVTAGDFGTSPKAGGSR